MDDKDKKPYDALDFGKTDPLFKELYAKKSKKPTYKDKKKFSKIRNMLGRRKVRSTSEK